jgi:hypothetical protein
VFAATHGDSLWLAEAAAVAVESRIAILRTLGGRVAQRRPRGVLTDDATTASMNAMLATPSSIVGQGQL